MGYRYEFTGESLIFLRENDSLSSKVLGVSFYRRVVMEEAKTSCWKA
jgi:hypothetical protein